MNDAPLDGRDTPTERLDVAAGDAGTSDMPRPWLGIRFECCNAYARIYRDRSGSAYVGWCPRCGRPVRIRIGPGGTDARFFTAY